MRLARAIVSAALLALCAGRAAACPADGCGADTTAWYERYHELRGVTIEKRRERYSRKGNAAVELMRRVIAARAANSPEALPYYSAERYSKWTLAINEVTPEDLSTGPLKGIPDALDYVEVCPYNNRLILPLNVSERIERTVFSREPRRRKQTITLASRRSGLSEVMMQGPFVSSLLERVFDNIEIGSDRIRVFSQAFTSPTGRGAISLYHYSIADTTEIGGERCVHVRFTPANPLDIAFNGDLFITCDGRYQVAKCEMSLPYSQPLNYVNGLLVSLTFRRLDDGRYVPEDDDMVVGLRVMAGMPKAIAIRHSRTTGFSTAGVDERQFKKSYKARLEAQAGNQDAGFWQLRRPYPLSGGESRLSTLAADFDRQNRRSAGRCVLRALIDNYVGIGGRSDGAWAEIGPLRSVWSRNFVDGSRLQIGGQTTSRLNPHFFFKGYYARGLGSHNDYYSASLTYSPVTGRRLPHDYPRRNITFSSSRELYLPSSLWSEERQHSALQSLRWAEDRRQLLVSRQSVGFEREEYCGLLSRLELSAQRIASAGELRFTPFDGLDWQTIPLTTATLTLRYAPHERFASTSAGRRPVDRDALVLELSHSVGITGVLGGRFRHNLTSVSAFRRTWLGSWGYVDARLTARRQWSRVPLPLLLTPETSTSYIRSEDGAFSLLRQMDLLADTYVAADLAWHLDGKLLSRVPLINRLKLREYFGIRAVAGSLSDKNKGALGGACAYSRAKAHAPLGMRRAGDGDALAPITRPYAEIRAGVGNIFRLLSVEYTRRIGYKSLPDAPADGVRFGVKLTF